MEIGKFSTLVVKLLLLILIGSTSIVAVTAFSVIKDGMPTLNIIFPHSTVWYTEGNNAYAKNIGKAFEYAYTQLQSYFPTPPGKFTIYVYHSQADLVQGLMKYSGFSPREANLFVNGGAPRPIDNIMHVGPAMNWWGVTHELTHAYIEKYSGEAYKNIKWLDEGLAEYMGWRITAAIHPVEAESERGDKWYAFTYLRDSNKLYPLSALTSETQWDRLYVSDKATIYEEAFVVVSYMASTYGLNKTIPILRSVQGSSAAYAVQTTTGQTESQILDSAKSAPMDSIFVTPEWSNPMLVLGVALTLTLMVVRRRSRREQEAQRRAC